VKTSDNSITFSLTREYAKKSEENRKKLASRTTGLIPIKEFTKELLMPTRLKNVLLSMCLDGVAYYLDDITLKVFLRYRNCGRKCLETLLSLIEELQNIPKYKEHYKALKKHFEEDFKNLKKLK
jgi:hypothetical protein